MIISQFPDLVWLKNQIADRFRNHRGYGDLPLESEGFPSVIINTRSTEAYRPDVTGPISLFLNLSGQSHCTVDNRRVTVPEDYYFISNRFQPYTLEIQSRKPVETFNIHIGESFSEGVISALLTPADHILQQGCQQKAAGVSFHNRLYRKDEGFLSLVRTLKASRSSEHFNKPLFDETLVSLMVYLVRQQKDLHHQVSRMPALKAATREELFRRLSISLDYLHSRADSPVDLDGMAAEACLSKFHFLRLFKQTYGLTPYQYWQQLRLEKAERLLKETNLPVYTIADLLGFENANSFSRLFRQRRKVYPGEFRVKS